MNFLVLYKLLKSKITLVNSFCKECGVDVYDFYAPSYIWNKVKLHIKLGNVLCYNCFCKKCRKLGLPSVWKLTPL